MNSGGNLNLSETIVKADNEEIPLKEHYVYVLIDPRDKEVFYVGKGQRNRLAHHVLEANRKLLSESNVKCANQDNSVDNDEEESQGAGENEKVRRIQAIHDQGHQVTQLVIARFTTEAEAFAVESVLIHWVYGRLESGGKLTNVQSGHNHRFVRKLGNFGLCELIDIPKKMKNYDGEYSREKLQLLLKHGIPDIAIETVSRLRSILQPEGSHIEIGDPIITDSGRYVAAVVNFGDPAVILRLQFSHKHIITNLRAVDENARESRKAFESRISQLGLIPKGNGRYCWLEDNWCNSGIEFGKYKEVAARITSADVRLRSGI